MHRSRGKKKYVSVCGEAAADPALAVVLIGLGVDTLSMNAGAIPAVAAVLKSVTKEGTADCGYRSAADFFC